jgi:hypothetical protein
MWRCPKCQSKVDDSFEVCWSCGTSADGVEDPTFLTADETEPIEDPDPGLDAKFDDALGDFAGTPLPDLVECYAASDTIEAKFIADRLMEQGIPALAYHHNIDMVMGGVQPSLWGYGPKVRIRPEDLPRAQTWLADYERRRKEKRGEQDRSS